MKKTLKQKFFPLLVICLSASCIATVVPLTSCSKGDVIVESDPVVAGGYTLIFNLNYNNHTATLKSVLGLIPTTQSSIVTRSLGDPFEGGILGIPPFYINPEDDEEFEVVGVDPEAFNPAGSEEQEEALASIHTLVIPGTIENLGEQIEQQSMCDGLTGLEKVIFQEGVKRVFNVFYHLSEDIEELEFVLPASMATYTGFSEGIWSLGAESRGLKTVNISLAEGVTNLDQRCIGGGGFTNENLETINFNCPVVGELNQGAFSGCPSLANVNYNLGVTAACFEDTTKETVWGTSGHYFFGTQRGTYDEPLPLNLNFFSNTDPEDQQIFEDSVEWMIEKTDSRYCCETIQCQFIL